MAGRVLVAAPALRSEPRLADREAIEEVLSRANIGFELSDADLFAGAHRLDEKVPVSGYDRMVCHGRDAIRTIVIFRPSVAMPIR